MVVLGKEQSEAISHPDSRNAWSEEVRKHTPVNRAKAIAPQTGFREESSTCGYQSRQLR
jgi:hypothetical protein